MARPPHKPRPVYHDLVYRKEKSGLGVIVWAVVLGAMVAGATIAWDRGLFGKAGEAMMPYLESFLR
ncbi:hypothetical protein [Croceicoccus naphthovorans]|uniref:Uncharacterized protein n=1 Tax=Croceicoccus naphthovorans TaxID=1348774 RepID=A0A0G3XGB7_9SPHN|nr:hypothetical protein [Croceicoccus naphthovorans]AKM09654.1 hypothetical protein AB433_06115 [Croceicoccus naphthovorans]MBB3990773.1 hypothetical protein [Croceicoccus naphthovorans]